MHSLNPFTSVRPRGATVAPSKKPHTGNRSRAPAQGRIHRDAQGRVIDLTPRTKGAIVIEPREQYLASVDKRRGISPRGTK